MSLIRSRNTKLELSFLKVLSKTLYPAGYRYRKHYRGLKGQPDIVFTKQRVVVFLDGDFWHGYGVKNGTKKLPKGYWQQKIKRNINRDRRTNRELKQSGWTVLRFWEHDIKKNPVKAL